MRLIGSVVAYTAVGALPILFLEAGDDPWGWLLVLPLGALAVGRIQRGASASATRRAARAVLSVLLGALALGVIACLVPRCGCLVAGYQGIAFPFTSVVAAGLAYGRFTPARSH